VLPGQGVAARSPSCLGACCTRVFDIGYDANGPEEAFRSEIRSETIQNVAAIGASIMVTIYPPDPGDDDGQ
jgi:hypothetical protein